MSEKISTELYRLSVEDFKVLHALQRRRLAWWRPMHWLIPVGIVLCVVWAYQSPQSPWFFLAVMLAVYWPTLAVLAYWWQPRRQFKLQSLDKKDMQFEFAEDGFHHTFGQSTGTVSWADIGQLDETDTHFVLWMNKMLGYVVPKRVFLSDADRAAFAALASQQVGNRKL